MESKHLIHISKTFFVKSGVTEWKLKKKRNEKNEFCTGFK